MRLAKTESSQASGFAGIARTARGLIAKEPPMATIDEAYAHDQRETRIRMVPAM
jgi:hypothetical protein